MIFRFRFVSASSKLDMILPNLSWGKFGKITTVELSDKECKSSTDPDSLYTWRGVCLDLS